MDGKRTKPSAASGSAITSYYLILYNLASAAAWAYTLYLLCTSLIEKRDVRYSYSACGWTVTIVQTFAILEILHALLGLVRTPVMTTLIQVSSRLLLVWGVVDKFPVPEVRIHWAFSTMVGAWCLAEIVRYLYYAFNLVGYQPAWLLWCRYNFFFVLYPVGAGSEWVLLVRSMVAVKQYSESLYYIYMLIAGLYPFGLYLMYTHMMRQRRKYMKETALNRAKKTR